MAYNPQNLRSIVPTPLVSVGQLQQGINQQAQNLQNIGQGLDKLARIKNEAKLNKAAQGLDFTNSQQVLDRLSPLLGFTTDEAKQNILNRLKYAAADEQRKSQVKLNDLRGLLTGQQIEESKIMTPLRANQLRTNIQRTKELTPLEKRRLNQEIDSSKERINQGWAKIGQGDRRLNLQEMLANRQSEDAKSKAQSQQALRQAQVALQEAYRSQDPNQIRKATNRLMLLGGKPDDMPTTSFLKGQQERAKEQSKSNPAVLKERLKNLIYEGYGDTKGNWVDRKFDDNAQLLINSALEVMKNDPAYSRMLTSGDPEAIYQALKDYLGSKGQRLVEEYDFDFLSPRTWFLPQVKIK